MSQLLRWTRDGFLPFAWCAHETVEKLAISPQIRNRIELTASSFKSGQEAYHSVHLSWRRGFFFFGPSGTGKTAASRALARALDWPHLTIPAHEILDAHLFERALWEVTARPAHVVVLENVDIMIKRMETEDFFTLLDHAMERAEGSFWIATDRKSTRLNSSH